MMPANQRKLGVVLNYIYLGVNALANLLYVPILLGTIGASQYGLYQTIGSFVAYLSVLSTGMGSMVTRYYSFSLASADSNKQSPKILGIATSAYTVVTAISLVASLWIYFSMDSWFSGTFTQYEMSVAKQMMIVVSVNMAIFIPGSMFAAVINAEERFVFAQTINLVRAVLQPVMIVAVVQFHSSALSIVLVQLVLNLAVIVINAAYSFSKLHVHFDFKARDAKLLKEMLVFLAFALLGLVFDQILWRTDQIILGALFGTGTVALYSIATTIVAAYISLSNSVANVLLPKVSKMIASGASNHDLDLIFAKVGRIQTWIVTLIELGFVLLGRDFISLWAGSDYAEAYYIVIIFMIGMHTALIQNLGQAILQGKNKQGFKSVVYLLIALVNVVLSIVASMRFGYMACAISSMFCLLVGTGPVINWYYKRRIGLNIGYFFIETSKLLPSAFAPFFVCLILRGLWPTEPTWVEFLGWGACFVAMFVLTTFKFGLSASERSSALSLFNKRP